MKRLLRLVAVSSLVVGGIRFIGPVKSTEEENVVPKESSLASSANGENGPTTTAPTPVPDAGLPEIGIAYPEKSDVLAILHRAREMRQQWQFDSALMLVSQALAIDPSSPLAKAMEREISQILNRLRAPGPQQQAKQRRYAV